MIDKRREAGDILIIGDKDFGEILLETPEKMHWQSLQTDI
jgi:hypothetical protein